MNQVEEIYNLMKDVKDKTPILLIGRCKNYIQINVHR